VPAAVIRILSDLHYGDRLSRVRSFGQLRPLCAGIDGLTLNGDTLDTRRGPNPSHTARCREDLAAFIAQAGVPVTLLTGNHDPDGSDLHTLDYAQGEVLVIHGDILYECIVPWGRDAKPIRHRVRAELAALPAGAARRLEDRLLAFRRVAASLEQRHQAERHPVKYAYRFLTDTLWPPSSAMAMLRAWRDLPALAAGLAREHRPRARFVLVGHTHRPGVWRMPSGVVVINTGSFSPPFGGYAVDLSPTTLTVRRIEFRAGEFQPGGVVAEFPLGRTADLAQHHAA
jgi:predicted phosphodiesterase